MAEATRKIVPMQDFAKAVREASEDGTGIDGIAEKTGLKRTSVNTRLNSLRKLVGAENVPSFQGGRKGANKDEILAILHPQPQS